MQDNGDRAPGLHNDTSSRLGNRACSPHIQRYFVNSQDVQSQGELVRDLGDEHPNS
jgi:hypothetical protein